MLCLSACDDQAWNDPYPNQSAKANTIYTAFSEQPKHLDPAISYSADETVFLGQIYEPVLEYSYLLRPYKLQPLIAAAMPTSTYDAKANTTTFHISIKPQIMYQPHPAFAKDKQGEYFYHNLTAREAKRFYNIQDFTHTGTRELTAADYANQIKRLADPSLNSPILGFMSPYIVGLPELRQQLIKAYAENPKALCLDLRNFELSGVKVLDDYNYTITINGKYDQFKYWLEMNFFAPVPWEAAKFYCQSGMEAHNISLDTYPIGTGAFYLTENNPERRMVMVKNPNFHPEYYPSIGMPEDVAAGLLKNAGKRIPLVDRVIFSLEKEDVPYWDKFMQGYYDRSGISSNNFNSAMSQSAGTGMRLSQELIDKGIRLTVASTLSTFYWGFNMLDEVVGGDSERARNLRKAIGLAFDMEEYITIFLNGRAIPAHGPIPPGIFGYEETQTSINSKEKLIKAKELLARAGYPNGRDAKTGKQLQVYYDAVSSGDPNERASFGWITKQFNKLGIDLIIRATDYNRFQDKMHNGNVQMFFFGWSMDYPDPENILFLFYGPNSRVKNHGENSTNYSNPNFDKLFVQFKSMGDDPKRLSLIKQMIAILQEDSPWVWGIFPQAFVLSNPWYGATKPSNVSVNTLKYVQIDPELRAKLRLEWNQPIIWPIAIVILVLLLILTPAIIGYMRTTVARAKRKE